MKSTCEVGWDQEYSDQSGWRTLLVTRMDVQSVGFVGNDVIKIRAEDSNESS